MTRFTVAIIVLTLVQLGCTSMQRVDTTPEDLQARIRAGEYLNEGQDVTITTSQGKELRFRFQAIENDSIVGNTALGEQASVPIAEVARLKTDRVNAGRTAAAVGGSFLLSTLIAFGILVAGGVALL